MLDAASAFPAPAKPEAVDYIVETLRKEAEFDGVSTEDMRFVAKLEFDAFGKLGSLAAWLSITSHRLMENVRKALRKKFEI